MGFCKRHPRLCAVIIAFLLYGVACVVGGIVLAEFAIHPPRDRASKIPTTIFPRYLGISEEPVEIQARDGAILRATYALPNSNDNGKTVIALHGVADERSGMIGFARLFLANGYRVLLPDSRAQGGAKEGLPPMVFSKGMTCIDGSIG